MEEAVTWQEMSSSDLRGPEVNRKWRCLTGSHLQVAVEGKKLLHTVHFTSYKPVARREAITWQKVTSRELRWPKVTRKWRHLTGTHLQVAVEGQKLLHTVHFTSYKPVARRRRQSRHRKWRHVNSGDWKWHEVALFDQKSPGSASRKPKTRVYCTFHFLQACSSLKYAVTWQEMTSRDLRWP